MVKEVKDPTVYEPQNRDPLIQDEMGCDENKSEGI